MRYVIESGHIVLSETATNLNTDSKVKAAYLGGGPRGQEVRSAVGTNFSLPGEHSKEKRFL